MTRRPHEQLNSLILAFRDFESAGLTIVVKKRRRRKFATNNERSQQKEHAQENPKTPVPESTTRALMGLYGELGSMLPRSGVCRRDFDLLITSS